MQWSDEAIVLGVRRHGETSVIAEVMTRGRGRHLGMVRGGRSRTMQPVLQPGNSVDVTWRAVEGETHSMLRQASAWHRESAQFLAESLHAGLQRP